MAFGASGPRRRECGQLLSRRGRKGLETEPGLLALRDSALRPAAALRPAGAPHRPVTALLRSAWVRVPCSRASHGELELKLAIGKLGESPRASPLPRGSARTPVGVCPRASKGRVCAMGGSRGMIAT